MATDRLSAFDYILPDPIPQRRDAEPNLRFLVRAYSTRAKIILSRSISPTFRIELQPFRSNWRRRSMIVQKTKPLPWSASCAVISSAPVGRITRRQASVCGHTLPSGLKQAAQLPQPHFHAVDQGRVRPRCNIDWAMLRDGGRAGGGTVRAFSSQFTVRARARRRPRHHRRGHEV